jgi:hypothetical protein
MPLENENRRQRDGVWILFDSDLPLQSPEEIEKWIAELEEMRQAHAGDAMALECIDMELSSARHWLELKKDPSGPFAPHQAAEVLRTLRREGEEAKKADLDASR